jgi:hypothetical protein
MSWSMVVVVGMPFDKAFLISLASALDNVVLAPHIIWFWVWVGCESAVSLSAI